MNPDPWPAKLISPPAAEITFDGHQGAYAHTFDRDRLAISNEATGEAYEVVYSACRLAEHLVLFHFIKPDPGHLVAVDVVIDYSLNSAFSVHQYLARRENASPQLYLERGSIGSRFRVESMMSFSGWESTPSRLQFSADDSPQSSEEEYLDRLGRLNGGSGRALDLGHSQIAIVRREANRTSFIVVNRDLHRYTATHLTAGGPVVTVAAGSAVLSPR